MNSLDVAILAAMLVAVGIGFIQGFLRQVVGLASLYLAVVLAAQYHIVVGNSLATFLQADPALRANVAFILILFWAMMFLGWVSRRVYPTMRIMRLGLFDNLFGAVLGIVTGGVVIYIVATVLGFATSVPWPIAYEDTRASLTLTMKASAMLPFVASYAGLMNSTITPWFPAGVPALFAQYYLSP
jgi:uncharacterized membrane protein required for colicin V production